MRATAVVDYGRAGGEHALSSRPSLLSMRFNPNVSQASRASIGPARCCCQSCDGALRSMPPMVPAWCVCWVFCASPSQISPDTLSFELVPNSQPGCVLSVSNSSDLTIAFKVLLAGRWRVLCQPGGCCRRLRLRGFLPSVELSVCVSWSSRKHGGGRCVAMWEADSFLLSFCLFWLFGCFMWGFVCMCFAGEDHRAAPVPRATKSGAGRPARHRSGERVPHREGVQVSPSRRAGVLPVVLVLVEARSFCARTSVRGSILLQTRLQPPPLVGDGRAPANLYGSGKIENPTQSIVVAVGELGRYSYREKGGVPAVTCVDSGLNVAFATGCVELYSVLGMTQPTSSRGHSDAFVPGEGQRQVFGADSRPR